MNFCFDAEILKHQDRLNKLNQEINAMNAITQEALQTSLQDLILINYRLYQRDTLANKQYLDKSKNLSKLAISLFERNHNFYNIYGLIEDNYDLKMGVFYHSIKLNKFNPVAINNLAF